MTYTVIMKRGTKPALTRSRETLGQARQCAEALADLHGVRLRDIIEDGRTFRVDASAYYTDDPIRK